MRLSQQQLADTHIHKGQPEAGPACCKNILYDRVNKKTEVILFCTFTHKKKQNVIVIFSVKSVRNRLL